MNAHDLAGCGLPNCGERSKNKNETNNVSGIMNLRQKSLPHYSTANHKGKLSLEQPENSLVQYENCAPSPQIEVFVGVAGAILLLNETGVLNAQSAMRESAVTAWKASGYFALGAG